MNKMINANLRYSLSDIKANVDWNKIVSSIPDYLYLQKKKFDDIEYEKKFTSFYKLNLGKNNNAFKKKYFALLKESSKKNTVHFENVIQRLSKINSKSQLSFSSKLVATIDNKKCVIDSRILHQLSISRYYIKDTTKRQKRDIEIYNAVNKFFNAFAKQKEGKELLKIFNDKTKKIKGATKVSAVKKLDFIFWQTSLN